METFANLGTAKWHMRQNLNINGAVINNYGDCMFKDYDAVYPFISSLPLIMSSETSQDFMV